MRCDKRGGHADEWGIGWLYGAVKFTPNVRTRLPYGSLVLTFTLPTRGPPQQERLPQRRPYQDSGKAPACRRISRSSRLRRERHSAYTARCFARRSWDSTARSRAPTLPGTPWLLPFSAVCRIQNTCYTFHIHILLSFCVEKAVHPKIHSPVHSKVCMRKCYCHISLYISVFLESYCSGLCLVDYVIYRSLFWFYVEIHCLNISNFMSR